MAGGLQVIPQKEGHEIRRNAKENEDRNIVYEDCDGTKSAEKKEVGGESEEKEVNDCKDMMLGVTTEIKDERKLVERIKEGQNADFLSRYDDNERTRLEDKNFLVVSDSCDTNEHVNER